MPIRTQIDSGESSGFEVGDALPPGLGKGAAGRSREPGRTVFVGGNRSVSVAIFVEYVCENIKDRAWGGLGLCDVTVKRCCW